MKLPNINYKKPVQSLGRYDISGPGQVGRAKAEVAKAAGRAINMVAESAQNHILKNSKVKTEEDMASFEGANAGKSFYSAEEIASINDDGLNKQFEGRDNIPASEIYPQLYEKAYKSAIDRHRGPLVGRWARDYDQSTDMDMFNQVAKRTAVAHANQLKEQDAETSVNIDEAIANRHFDQAVKYVDNMNSSDYDKDAKKFEINEAKRVEVVSEIIRTENVNEAITERDRLRDTVDTGFSDESAQLTQKLRLDAFLNKVSAAGSAARNSWLEQLKSDMRDAKDIGNMGGDHNQAKLADIDKRINATEEADIPEDLRRDYRRAKEANSIYQQMKMKSIAERSDAIQVIDRTKVSHSDELMGNTVNKLLVQSIEHSVKDPIGYNQENGLYVPPVALEGFNDDSLINFKNANDLRLDHATTISSQLGVETKWLSVAEAKQLAAQMNDIPSPDQFLTIAGLVYDTYGQDSAAYWDQVRVDGGMEGRYSALGGLIVRSPKHGGQPDTSTAVKILQGRELRKTSVDKLIDYETTKATIVDELGGAYNSNSKYRDAIVQNSIDALYYLSKGADDGKFAESDDVEAAVQMATGGLVEGDDYTIEAPYDNSRNRVLNQAEWNYYTDGAKGDEFPDNSFMNYTNDEIAEKIQDDDVVFMGVGDGSYYLQTEKGTIQSSNGGPFVFNYNDVELNRPIDPGFFDELIYRTFN